MLPAPVLRQIVAEIHAIPELRGVTVGLYENGQCKVISPGFSGSPYSSRIVVILEQVEGTDDREVAELRALAQTAGTAAAPVPAIFRNKTLLGAELVGAGVNCLFTAVAALGVVAGVAGEIPTGGASSFLVAAAWIGLGSTSLQCANGVVRVGEILARPEASTVQGWDSNSFYAMASLLVDAAGVGSGVAALPYAVRNLMAVLARQRAFVARGLTADKLRWMNRAERFRVISEVMEDAGKTPEGRQALLQAARDAQISAKTLGRSSGMSVRHAASLATIISKETTKRLVAGLTEILATAGGVAASSTPARMTGSASGSVNWAINLVDSG